MGNFAAGIVIQDSSNNTIGGTTAGAGNVISGNGAQGLEITGTTANGNQIEGNIVGLTPLGNAAIGNGNDGIWLENTQSNIIGGSIAGAGNIISGNTASGPASDGIWIDQSNGNVVWGNTIGSDAAQDANFGNYHDGINLTSSSSNVIGGINAGQANFIAYNDKGVVVVGTGATGDAIRGNTITLNTLMGIDLGDDGITANSGVVNPAAPNQGMNDPVLTPASLQGSTLFIEGYVGNAPNDTAFGGAQVDL